MKLAREWANQLFDGNATPTAINIVRSIQADALRYAANLSGDLHRVQALIVADALDRIVNGTELPNDRELENSLE